jgi:hypothetical protein
VIAKRVWWYLALALGGFLAGVYVATGRDTSVVRALCYCPPSILLVLQMTDPRQSDLWMLVAPLNAFVWAGLGWTISALLN